MFLALVFVLRDVLLPFVAGMAIAYFLDPACDKLEEMGLSRVLATSLITAVLFSVRDRFPVDPGAAGHGPDS